MFKKIFYDVARQVRVNPDPLLFGYYLGVVLTLVLMDEFFTIVLILISFPFVYCFAHRLHKIRDKKVPLEEI